MRAPVTLSLLIPFLLISFAFFGDAGSVISAICLAAVSFLIEVRIRYGKISRANLSVFFNTPVEKVGLGGEKLVDKSPRVSLFQGVLVILGGSAIVVFLLILFFGHVAQNGG